MQMQGLMEQLNQFNQQATSLEMIQFYAAIGAAIGVVVLFILWLRERSKTSQTARRLSEMMDDLRQMHDSATDMERRVERKISNQTSDLEKRLTDRMERTEDRFEDRIDEKAGNVAERLGTMEARWKEFGREIDKFRERVDEV